MATRVLIVEDAADLREELVDYLRFSGFHVSGAGSVAELIAHLNAEPVDVVILDLGLPDGDGLVAAQRIRRARGLDLGIVIITARGQTEDRIAGARAGADAYLVKPVDLRELTAVISHLVRRLAVAPPSVQQWSFDPLSQTLRTPEGRPIEVTGAEGLVLSLLLETPGKIVHRSELCAVLAPGGDPEDTRRLDWLISRLRTKVLQEAETSLPIRAVRNRGYSFTEEAHVTGG